MGIFPFAVASQFTWTSRLEK